MNQRKSRRWVAYLLSGFLWTVHGAGLAIVAAMTWSVGAALDIPELLVQGGIVGVVFVTLLWTMGIRAWRKSEPAAFIGSALAFAVIASAPRVFLVFKLVSLIVAQQPAPSVSQLAGHPTANAPAPGSDVRDWQRNMTVTTGKGKRLAPEATGATEASKPDPPALTSAKLASRPADKLAAALGLDRAMFDVVFSVVVAVSLEFVMILSIALAVALLPTGDEPPHAQTEALSMALQLIGLMTWIQGMTSPSAREAPQRSPPEAKPVQPAPAPARPSPVVGNGSPARVPHSTRRPRVPEQVRAHDLHQLLQQSQRGGFAEIRVLSDGSLFCTCRGLAALLQCGPGAVNGALHRLAADGQITLEPGARGTRIRVLWAPAGQADILGSPRSRTETAAEGVEFGSSAPA